MNSCNFRAPNGENSLLFAGLEQLVGTSKAAVIWNQVQTDEFKEKYGDWSSQPMPTHDIDMQPDNIAKINAGQKTTTTRSEAQSKKIGISTGETGTVRIGEQLYSVTNRGKLSIKEAGGLAEILKSEGVSSVDDFKFVQTKAWADGKGKLYVYDIKPFKASFPLDTNGEPTVEWVLKQIPPTPAEPLKEEQPPTGPKVFTLADLASGKAISEAQLLANISKIYDEAAANPEQQYQLELPTGKERIKMQGRESMSMYELAAWLDKKAQPYNLSFGKDFEALRQNMPARFLGNAMYRDDADYIPKPYDSSKLKEQLDTLYVPVRDANGYKTGGYFDPERQTEVVNTIIYMVKEVMTKAEALKDGRLTVENFKAIVKNALSNKVKDYGRIANGEELQTYPGVTAEQAKALAQEFQLVLNSFDVAGGSNFWALAMDRMAELGIKLRGKKFVTSESTVTDVTEIENKDGETFEAEEGKHLENWSDSHFEHDPTDSATGRIKLFLATIEDSRVGVEDLPRKVKLPFSNNETRAKILNEVKKISVRSAEHAKEMGLTKPGDTAIFDVSLDKGSASQMFRVTAVRVVTTGDVLEYSTQIQAEEGYDMQIGDMLYQIEQFIPKEAVVIANKNYLGMPKLVNYEKLFHDVLGKLAGQERSMENYIRILKEEGNKFNPNLRALAEKLENANTPQDLKNEFVSVVTLQYQPFTIILLDQLMDSNDMPYYVLRPINANSYSQQRVIKEHWQQNQKFAPILKRNTAGITVVDKEKAAELLTELNRINELYVKQDKSAHNKAIELFRKVLHYNGITMPDEAIKSFIKDTEKWTKGTTIAGSFRAQFAVSSEKGKPQGIVSAMILTLNGRVLDENVEDTAEDKSYMLDNPLYTESTSMDILARITARFTTALYSNTHRSAEGKTIYDYGYNSTLSNEFRKLSDLQHLQSYGDVDFANKSFMLTRLLNDEALRQNISLTYLDAIKPTYTKRQEGVVRPNMSAREQFLTALGLFYNRGNSTAHYISLTHSDKTTTPVWMNMPKLKVMVSKFNYDPVSQVQTVTQHINEEVFTELFNVFYSEYDRIQRASEVESYNHSAYEKGAKHFFFLPQFNYQEAKKNMPAEDVATLYYSDGTLRPRDNARFKEVVKKNLEQYIRQLQRNTYNQWIQNQIVTGDNFPIDRRYVNSLLASIGINSVQKEIDGKTVYVYEDLSGTPIEAKQAMDWAAKLAAREFAVNSFLMNTSMSQILYGDPAQVWKGSVEATMVEYGKRLAKDLAPGREGNWGPGATYVSVTIKDFMTSASYLKEIKEVQAAYNDGNPINASDGQEIVTVQEHLDVLYAYGRITPGTYQEMSQIIKDVKGGYYEFTEPHHLAVVLQPMKPVYVHPRGAQNGAILFDYVKPSAYPLYPPFLVGKELDKLRSAMEKGGVARVNFESAKKMGKPGETVEVFATDGTVNDDVFNSAVWTGRDKNGNEVASARQVLSRDGFRIQQEVPYDEMKESIRTVSQMNKLITESIALIKSPFTYRGEKKTGAELRQIKEDIRKQLFQMNAEKLWDELGIITTDAGLHFKDRNKLFNALEKRLLEGSAGFTINDLAYVQNVNRMQNLDELVIPLMYAPSASKFESMLMSMVGEIANIKMPGKSYVQASAAGHQKAAEWESLTVAQKARIVTVEGYDGGPLKTLHHEDGTVRYAQVLMPFNFISGGRRLSIDQFTKTLEDGRVVLDHEKVPQELLQHVSARIPNQGPSSQLIVEVVGFVSDNMGDLAIVPAAITKQMGSDFDVDKLYAYRRAYRYRDGKLEVETEGEMGLKNDYFDVHWSVLSHPAMTRRILAPLDKSDLKDEAKAIEDWASTKQAPVYYYDPTYQLNDFLAQKDAKQLVALSSLATTFNAVIQDKNILPGYVDFDGNGDPVVVKPDITLVDENEVERNLSTLSGYGSTTYNGQVRSKHDNHTTAQSEFVDYAKNKISDKVHLNTYTYPASMALSQLQTPDRKPSGPLLENGETITAGTGWIAHLGFNSRLLSQPIIKEFAVEMARSGDSLSPFDPKVKDTVMAKLVGKYLAQAEQVNEVELQDYTVSYADLTSMLKTGKDQQFNQKQLFVLGLFSKLDEVGSEMIKAMSLINHDTKGAGPNMLELLRKEQTRSTMVSPIYAKPDSIFLFNLQDLFGSPQQRTEQGMLFDIVHKTADTLVGEFFPYRQLKPLFDKVTEHANRTELSLDNQKIIFNAMKSYLFSHPKLGLWENPVGTRASLLFNRDGKPSLAERVLDAKNTWGQNNYFLQRLQLNIDPDGVNPSTIRYLASKATDMDDSENTRAWMELLISDDSSKRMLGEDLIRYVYLTGGVQDSSSFVKYIPYGYLLGTDFGLRLNELTANIGNIINTEAFRKQLMQHNPQLAMSLSSDLTELGLDTYPEEFTLPEYNPEARTDERDPLRRLLVSILSENGKRVRTYPDYLSYYSVAEHQWILYEKTAETVTGPQSYKRIDQLGDNSTDEYSFEPPAGWRSLIAKNRAKEYDNITPLKRMLGDGTNAALHPGAAVVQKDLGIAESGDYPGAVQILRKIVDDNRIPNYLRVVSGWLSTIPEGTISLEFYKQLEGNSQQSGIPKFSYKISSDPKDFEQQGDVAAYFDSYNRQLVLGAHSLHDKTRLALFMNHELMHAHTSMVTLASESEEYLKMRFSPAQIAFAKGEWERFVKKHPEAQKAIDRLHEVRRQVERAVRKQMERAGYDYDTVARQIMDKKFDKHNPFTNFVYATMSNTEFVAHATSDLDLMRFLNGIEYEGESEGNLLDQLVGIIRTLLSAISAALGQPINKNSLLDKSIRRSMELATFHRITPHTAADLASGNNMLNMFGVEAILNTTAAPRKTTAVQRLIGKLQEQREQLVHSLTGNEAKEDYADKQSKIEQIEIDIQKLENDDNLDNIAEIGVRHMQWVETVLKLDNPTESQLMTASRVVETWKTLIDIVYPVGSGAEEVDSRFSQISATAESHDNALFAKMLKYTRAKSGLSSKDITPEAVTDAGKFQTLLRSMSSATSAQLPQYFASFMETVARDRDESNVRFSKWIDEFEKEMKDAAGSTQAVYDLFMQKNKDGSAFGLVQRYSQDWYDYRRMLKALRQSTVEHTMKAGYTPAEARKARAQAWQKYWKSINEAAIFADTRLLFEEATGARKTDPEALAHIAELEAELGEAAAADLINKAEERYLDYLEKKQAHQDMVDGAVATGTMTAEEANISMLEYKEKNSPNVFFNAFKSKDGKFRDVNSDHYVAMAPKRSVKNGIYYDSKFEEIQNNPKLKAVYDKYRTKLAEFKKMLPIYVQKGLSANFLPVVHKNLVRDSMGIREWLEGWPDRYKNSITASEYEEMLNQQTYNKIPIDYIDGEKVELEDRSNNLLRILENFGVMAHHYKYFSEAKNFIDMGESILTHFHEARTKGASQETREDGRLVSVKGDLKNTVEAFKYMKEYLMYHKSRKLEAKGGKLYSLKPWKQLRLQNEVKALRIKRFDIANDPNMDPLEQLEALAKIDEELGKPEYQGRHVFGSRVGDKIIRFNQLKALSYNPISAFANLTFGLISAHVHANGKRDFTNKELMASWRMMTKSMAKWATFGTIEHVHATKMLAIMDRLGIVGDYIDSNYGIVKVRDRKPGWQRRLNPYALMQSGDYFMKALTTHAMLIHQKVKVTENGQEKEISLWEALNAEGEWDTERFGENKEWSSETTSDQKQWQKFKNRAIRVNVVIHGNQDKNSPKLLNQTVLGRLVGQFRLSWLPEGWNNRFQNERFDQQLGRSVKGRYRSYWDVGLWTSFKLTAAQALSVLTRNDPFSDYRIAATGAPLSEVDIENLRRNFAELSFIITVIGTTLLLKSLRDDDEEEDHTLQFTINMLWRVKSDLQFYSSPSTFDNITRKIIPATQVISDAEKAVKASVRYFITDEEYDDFERWLKAVTKAGLPIAQASLYPKMDYMLNRDLEDLAR
jgi:hypothetical protein